MTQPSAPPSLWAPLKRPAFRNLMIAVSASNTGYWMQAVAAAYLVRQWTGGEPLLVALVQTALFLPPAVLLLPAGALADSLDRRRFMMAAHGWMMAAAAAIAVLVLTGGTSAWALLALLGLFAVGFAFSTPAQSAIWVEMVGLKELPQAVAVYSLSNNGARILGPSLAGALIPWLGAASVMTLTALSYLGVIAALAGWRRAAAPVPRPAQPFWPLLWGGLAFARRSPPYRAVLVRGGLFFVVSAILLGVLPVKVPAADDFGTVFSFMGLGAILGVFSFPRVSHLHRRQVIVAWAVAVNALALAAMALVGSVWALSLLTAAAGYTWFFVMSALHVGAQMVLPDDLRGRGLALLNLVLMGTYALSSPLWGAVARLTDPDAAFAVAAATSLLALALTARMRLPDDRA